MFTTNIKNRPINGQASKFVDVVPADSDLSAPLYGLYVGTGGDLKVTGIDGGAVTFKNVGSGQSLAIQVKRVWLTGTTASNIIGFPI